MFKPGIKNGVHWLKTRLCMGMGDFFKFKDINLKHFLFIADFNEGMYYRFSFM